MAKKADPRIKTAWLNKHGLSDRQRAFVLAYLKSRVAVQAAAEAGYKHPAAQAARVFAIVGVQKAIDEGLGQIEEAAQVDAEKVLEELWGTYTADPAAMSRVERVACRYCHGTDGEYQWRTPREFREALTAAAEVISGGDSDVFSAVMDGNLIDSRIPSDAGGYGYSAKARPNPDCPECDGQGHERVYIADTRDLTPEAKRLFDGAKINAKGQIEIAQLDRAKALDSVAKHLGMFEGKGESGDVGKLGAAITAMMERSQAVPVVPDDPAKRMARVNRRIITTTTVTADEEEP